MTDTQTQTQTAARPSHYLVRCGRTYVWLWSTREWSVARRWARSANVTLPARVPHRPADNAGRARLAGWRMIRAAVLLRRPYVQAVEYVDKP